MGDDETRRLILARRARFLAAALASVAATAGACGGSVDEQKPTDEEQTDGGDPQPCLSVKPVDAGAKDATPQPCLEPLPPDAGDAGDAGADAEPQPCLSPPPPDGG